MATNARIKEWQKGLKAPKPVRPKKDGPYLFYPLFFMLNLPVIWLWRYGVKPKVWEPEFTGTLRFATALMGFLVYFGLLFAVFAWWLGVFFAFALVCGLFFFNWGFIKFSGWASH